MQKSGYLYLLFTALGGAVVVGVFLLYRLVPADTPPSLELEKPRLPSDFASVLTDMRQRDSWIFRIHLQHHQNIFTYPRTVYHINLN